MLTAIFVVLVGLIIFIFISIFYLPVVCLSEERKGVALARKAIRLVACGVRWSVGMTVDVIYKDKPAIDDLDKSHGIIYVSNHQSNLDIPAIIYGLNGEVGFVAKKEMEKWPFYGVWMKKMKCVFLDRKNPREGLKDIKKAIEIVKDGYPTVIFPEGERSLDGKIGTFKKGAFKLAVDTKGVIIPLILKGTYDIQHKGSINMTRGKKVRIIVEDPIYVKDMEREELKTLDKKVRDIIVKDFEDPSL